MTDHYVKRAGCSDRKERKHKRRHLKRGEAPSDADDTAEVGNDDSEAVEAERRGSKRHKQGKKRCPP